MNGRTLVFRPYPDMVRSLFKPMGTTAATALHAAVGIAGEASELALANSIEDVVLELGDVEFYVEALHQALGGRERSRELDVRLEASDPCGFQVLGTAPLSILITGGRILDAVKKSWVYGKALDEVEVRRDLMRLEVALDTVRALHGVRREDVLKANQYKLAKRYPGQVYTDAAAIERADVPSEGSDVQTSEHDGSPGAKTSG